MPPLVDVRGFGLNVMPQQGSLMGGLQEIQAFQQLGRQNIQAEKSAQIRQLLGQAGQVAPQTEQQQMLAAQTAELGGPQALAEQPRAEIPLEDLKELSKQISPEQSEKIFKSLGIDSASQREEMSRFAARLQSLPESQIKSEINARAQKLQSEGRDPAQTLQLLDMSPEQRDQALIGVQLAALETKERLTLQQKQVKGLELTSKQREFKSLTEGLTDEQKKEAALIDLGLSPRAVGSAVQTITDKGIADEIGKTEATISQRKKFGEMTGASRAKTIDKGFERIVKIDSGIRNIDRAIAIIKSGAGTGAVQKFLPSFRAASVELDQVKNEMALDVIGGVTLGAISEAELDLVKLVALPIGLDGQPLIDHLEKRKAAQTKIRAYFKEQIDFLDSGGTIAGFLREKERQMETQKTPTESQQAPESTPVPPPQGGITFLGFE